MKKEIKYIGFYNSSKCKHQRVGALSAINKMDYVCDAIKQAGYNVHLVSPSWIMQNSIELQRTISLSPTKQLTNCPSIGSGYKIREYLSILISLTWLFFWLLFNVKRDEKILVYHSPWFALPVLWAKRIKGFKLILEVEEIYSKVWSLNKTLTKWENKIILNTDGYIVVSDVLAEMLPAKQKIILYGSYNLYENLKHIRENNNVINVVYAGSLDKTIGGAFTIINTLNYLPINYMVHILGYGKIEEINEIKRLVKYKNEELGRISCLYHGMKTGVEFSDFLIKCDVAVNSQNQGNYMATAFPSKILTYLSHGLPVVTTKIESIIHSSIGKYLMFTDDDSPESIANGILSIDVNIERNYSNIVSKLNSQFVEEIKRELNYD